MDNLTIKDIIHNAITDFNKAKEIILDLSAELGRPLTNSDDEILTDTEELVFGDISASIERLSSIEDTILVALCAAVYAGNIESDGKGFNGDFGADSLEHRREYLAMAEQYELPYTEDGLISTEDVYNDISAIVQGKYIHNLPWSITIPASELELDTDDIFEDEDELSDIVSDYLSNKYGYCHYGFAMKRFYNPFEEPSYVEVTEIRWDFDAENDESEDEK